MIGGKISTMKLNSFQRGYTKCTEMKGKFGNKPVELVKSIEGSCPTILVQFIEWVSS